MFLKGGGKEKEATSLNCLYAIQRCGNALNQRKGEGKGRRNRSLQSSSSRKKREKKKGEKKIIIFPSPYKI